jgi:hypothetical protein
MQTRTDGDALMLRHGKTSAHLDDCLILKGIDVCQCVRCPTPTNPTD